MPRSTHICATFRSDINLLSKQLLLKNQFLNGIKTSGISPHLNKSISLPKKKCIFQEIAS